MDVWQIKYSCSRKKHEVSLYEFIASLFIHKLNYSQYGTDFTVDNNSEAYNVIASPFCKCFNHNWAKTGNLLSDVTSDNDNKKL